MARLSHAYTAARARLGSHRPCWNAMLEQLNSCVGYLEKLRAGLQDAPFQKVKSQQVMSLTKKLRQYSWTHESAAQVLEAIAAAGVFTADEQEELMTAVNVTEEKKGTLRPRQEATSFQEFLTESDHGVLVDQLATCFQKIDCVAARMVSMGLINPTEGTYGKVLMCPVITI